MTQKIDRGLQIAPQAWAARLPRASPVIGRLRLIPGIRVLADGDVVWLQGPDVDESLSVLLRSVPDAQRFLVAADGELTAWGETVPCAKLPEGDWQPIGRWLTVTIPTPAFAARVPDRIPLRLVRSDAASSENMLKTSWPVWRDYAITAPQVRLNQWSFAVSDSGEVLIRGLPLPPLPGRRLVESCGIAIPAGWKFDPAVDLESLRRHLPLDEGDLAMFHEDGDWEVVPAAVFVRATRSAVRLTDGG